jgi:hypothetical protein
MATYQIRFVHKDDFVSTHNYLTTYAGDVAALYEDGDIYDFDMPDPDSFIDSGGTFQSLPRSRRALFSIVNDVWSQEYILDAEDSSANPNEINGYLTHIALIYRRSAIGTETLMMCGVCTFETGTTRAGEIRITVYDFADLVNKALDLSITIGIKENAGTVTGVVFEYIYDDQGNYAQAIQTGDGDTLPEVGNKIAIRYGDDYQWIRDVFYVEPDDHRFWIYGARLEPDAIFQQPYIIRANVDLFNISSLISFIFSTAKGLIFTEPGTGFSSVQFYTPYSINSVVNQLIYQTGFINFYDTREITGTLTEFRDVGLYDDGSGIIKLILYHYRFSFFYFNGRYFWFERLKKSLIYLDGMLVNIVQNGEEYALDGQQQAIPSYLNHGGQSLWGTFETTLADTISDELGNDYTLTDSGNQLLFTGSTYLQSFFPVYGSYSLRRLWEAAAFFNGLVYVLAANGTITIQKKLDPVDIAPTPITDAQIVANTRTLPSANAMPLDREEINLDFIFQIGEGNNIWYDTQGVIDAIRLQYQELFPVRRGFSLVHYSSGFDPDIVKGDYIVEDDRVYYAYETQPESGLSSQKHRIGFWDVSAAFEYAAGSPVIIGGELQRLDPEFGIPVVDSAGRFIELSDGSFWVIDSPEVKLYSLDFELDRNSINFLLFF